MLGELFGPDMELLIEDGIRPHWSQTGAIVFVTFRTHDSVPKEVLRRWDHEKNEWMRSRGHTTGEHWSNVLPTLHEKEQGE